MPDAICPLCARSCPIGAHNGAYCAHCFHSFSAERPQSSLSAAQRYIADLPLRERDYARAHLAYLHEATDTAPYYAPYGLSWKAAQAIARRLGTLAC